MTPKQERFCQEYMIDLNATQAAIRAGYSEHTANEIGSQNLAKIQIKERIAELQGKAAERHAITLDSLTEMARAAYRMAVKTKSAAAMTGAVAQLSKMHGFDADSRRNDRSPLEGMSLDDLASIRSAVTADTGEAPGTRH